MPTLKDTALVLEAAADQLRASDEEMNRLRNRAIADEKEISRLRQELATPKPPGPPPEPTLDGIEGFGALATGGAGFAVVQVTNMNDAGAGSLRAALGGGNRIVQFTVGGTIKVGSDINVAGDNITIDGLSAPSPGVTLAAGGALNIDGRKNIIVRGIRVRGPGGSVETKDNIRVRRSSSIAFDRCSTHGGQDGALDITEGCTDITVQWCILSGSKKAALCAYRVRRISYHHNLWIANEIRNPFVDWDQKATSELAPEVVADIRNNLIWKCYRGADLRLNGKSNVVNNYYNMGTVDGHAPNQDTTIFVRQNHQAYVAGNFSQNGWNINDNGTVATEWPARLPVLQSAVEAARAVVAGAGARGPNFGLDAVDEAYIKQISIT